MKIEKFLHWILNNLLNYPEIDFKTVKRFMDKFNCMLSKREKERHSITLQIIREYTSKQITIDSFIFNDNIDKLDLELNNLKDDDNKE